MRDKLTVFRREYANVFKFKKDKLISETEETHKMRFSSSGNKVFS